MNSETYDLEETDSDVSSDYSDGVSDESINSDAIHIWAREKLKIAKERADRHSKDEIKQANDAKSDYRLDYIKEGSGLKYKSSDDDQNMAKHITGLEYESSDNDQNMAKHITGLEYESSDNDQNMAKYITGLEYESSDDDQNMAKHITGLEYESNNKEQNTADNNDTWDDASKLILGNCQIADDGKSNNVTNPKEVHRDLDQSKKQPKQESERLLCQYCKQDYRTSDAITYCMDCGLYMCASCRKFHQRFVATRGHSVAVQQELIPTEFQEYKPTIEEYEPTVEEYKPTTDEYLPTAEEYKHTADDKRKEKALEDRSLSPRLNTTLVDSGRYSRPLTPPNNALCGPCQYDGVGGPATHFCQTCGIYMCMTCYKFHHKLRKSYEQHSIIHQWDCEDFDTFVTSMEEEKGTVKDPWLYKDPFLKPCPPRMSQFSPALEPKGRFSIKMTTDPWECSVAGIDCFIDGRIVFTDENNRNVKLFSRQCQPLDVLELNSQPMDVAIVTNSKVAIFLPKESSLVFVKVHGNNLSLTRTIKTASKYLRIASRCEEIYALCDPEGQGQLWMNILNENGNIVTFVHLDFAPSDLPLVPGLAVSPAGGTVYISDRNGSIYAFGIDGRQIFKHRNSEMSDISDLVADARSIYACSKSLGGIFKLSYDGLDCCQVVEKTARIASPKTVAIQGNQLFVGLCDSDNIHIYSLLEIP